ncbi:MAG: hypothetical protein WC083_07950 [Candidatus Methanomethylophilaceae archaeon]|jgi:hypothetical protein
MRSPLGEPLPVSPLGICLGVGLVLAVLWSVIGADVTSFLAPPAEVLRSPAGYPMAIVPDLPRARVSYDIEHDRVVFCYLPEGNETLLRVTPVHNGVPLYDPVEFTRFDHPIEYAYQVAADHHLVVTLLTPNGGFSRRYPIDLIGYTKRSAQIAIPG